MSARGNGAVAKAHQQRGEVLQGLGRLDEAARHYRAALARQPDLAEAHCNLAAILIRQGAYEAALEHAARAAAARPELAEAHLNCAVAWSCRRRFVEAEAAYRRALALQPHNGQALSNLGVVLTELRRAEEAIRYHRAAIARQRDNPLFHLRLAVTQLLAGDPDSGEASCRDALSLAPQSAQAWNCLGHILRALGRFDEARSCLRRALALNPDLAEADAGLALIGERAQDGERLRHLHALLSDPNRPAMQRIDAGFALGRLLDNAERCDEAFPCFARANALYRRWLAESGAGFDRAALRRRIDALIEICTPELYAAAPATGNPAETPVLIVGMPRSGTSLVEQIAASHSRVTGAGELPDIGHIAGLLPFRDREPARQIDADLARRLADGYVARLQRLGRGAERVVDKTPDNIFALGMAALLWPRARIVFCRRSRTRLRSPRWTASTSCTSGPRICRPRWAFPGNTRMSGCAPPSRASPAPPRAAARRWGSAACARFPISELAAAARRALSDRRLRCRLHPQRRPRRRAAVARAEIVASRRLAPAMWLNIRAGRSDRGCCPGRCSA